VELFNIAHRKKICRRRSFVSYAVDNVDLGHEWCAAARKKVRIANEQPKGDR
jgi:hypothetical protein